MRLFPARRSQSPTAGRLYHAADAALKAGAPQQSRVLYSVALSSPQLTPLQRAYCQLQRALAEMELEDWQAARNDLNDSIALNPNFDGTYINRANIALHFGQYDAAIADCDAAIKLNPQRAEAFINRADSHAAKQETQAALDDFGRAATLQPDSAQVYLHRAAFFNQQHRSAEALADLERCLKLKPNPSFFTYQKAAALSALRKFHAASEAYERVLTLRPHPNARILNDIAWFYATCPDANYRRPAQAISLACRACDLTHWRSAVMRDTLAAAYAAAGDFRAVIENQRTVLAIGTTDPTGRAQMEQHLTLYERQQPYFVRNY